jgi:hypothetical protein
MAHAADANNSDRVGDLVYDTIISDANAPVVAAAGEFARAGRSRVVRERLDGLDDARVNGAVQLPKILLGSALK